MTTKMLSQINRQNEIIRRWRDEHDSRKTLRDYQEIADQVKASRKWVERVLRDYQANRSTCHGKQVGMF
jgi:hypothetical protein